MKRSILPFVLLLLFLFAAHLGALDIYCVPPEITAEPGSQKVFSDFLGALIDAVGEQDVFNSLRLIPEEREKPVVSLIDAGSLAMRRSRDYLLYGTVEINSRWCEVRYSLYELETDSIRTVFYSKAGADQSRDLIAELGRKVTDYFYARFGIEDRSVIKKSPGYLELSLDGGYWGVLSSTWSDLLIGYFHSGITMDIALNEPRYYFEGNELYPRFGIGLDYGFGRNKSGLESFSYNSFQMNIPLELILDLRQYHRFGLIVSPGYQIDYLRQERNYSEVYDDVSSCFLLKTGFSYMFIPPGKRISFGLVNIFDFSFYGDLQVSYKPSLRISWKILEFGESSDAE